MPDGVRPGGEDVARCRSVTLTRCSVELEGDLVDDGLVGKQSKEGT
jgi:hypothetical protein